MKIRKLRIQFSFYRNSCLLAYVLLQSSVLAWQLPLTTPVYEFGAEASEQGITVRWQTEEDNLTLGFNLYRSDDGGTFKQLNSAFLAGPTDAPAGAEFSWLDMQVAAGGSYRYQLEPVAPQGTYPVMETAPVVCWRTVRSRADETAASSYSVRPHRVVLPRSASLGARASARSAEVGGPDSELKITVWDRGVYCVEGSVISALLGMSINEVNALIAQRLFRLSSQGNQISWVPAKDGAGILFYNEPIDSMYTLDNVFWLKKGRGLVYPTNTTAAPPERVADQTFWRTMHAEENHSSARYYIEDPDVDYWYWGRFYSGQTAPEMSFWLEELQASGAATATISMAFFSSSTVGIPDEHHMVIDINGTQVAEGAWEGIKKYTVHGSFPATILSNGLNHLTLSGGLATNVTLSVQYWDWFDVMYKSSYTATSNMLLCAADAHSGITVDGFDSAEISVWDVTDPFAAQLNTPVHITESNSAFSVSFNARTNGRYYVITDAVVAPASNITAITDRYMLQSPTNQADYLVVTGEELVPALSPLIALRTEQGLVCRIVDIDAVYNGFSRGISTPYALRDFLGYCHDQWALSPAYVLLAGKGTEDYRGYRGGFPNIVPIKIVRNPFYPGVSDNWMGCDDGRGMPNVAIGRLPAISADELSNMVEKIVVYETDSLASAWSNTIIMAADNADSQSDFPACSDAVATNIPPSKTMKKIYLSELDITTARNNLMADLKDGSLFFNYIGHSGYQQIAAEKLLVNDDLPGLTNQCAMSIMLGMTCLINNVAHYSVRYIGERMVVQDVGAMIAGWAPCGQSLNELAVDLDHRFFYHYFNNTHNRLGDIVNQCLQDFLNEIGDVSETDQFILIGDPGLVVK